MTIASILLTDLMGVLVAVTVVRLIRRRLMSVGLGLSWLLVLGSLAVVVSVPGVNTLWIKVSTSFFKSPPYLVALVVFLLVFLLYQSVVISVLQRQVREMGQYIAISRAKGPETGTH